MRERYDVAVVGGGAVGLYAALKAAVLKQSVLVVDKGERFSRVAGALAVANLPGLSGISGPELLARLRRDLEGFAKLSGADLVDVLEDAEVVGLAREAEGFSLRIRRGAIGLEEARARVVILATGIVDRKPALSAFAWRGHETMAPFVRRGEVGYCILCEGWSLEGARVAVLGGREEGADVAKDLQAHFGARATLLPLEDAPGGDADAAEAGVRVDAREVRDLRHVDGALEVEFADGARERFDKSIFALGFARVNSGLAAMAGARTTREGFVATNEDCEALDAEGRVIRGLFAIGDVRDNKWKQIVVGWGEAERAVLAAYAKRLPD